MSNIQKQDSIKISHLQLVKATEALIELRNLKKQNYVIDERLRNKDVVIKHYENLYRKCNQSDSLGSILIRNKDTEITTLNNLYIEEKRERKIQKIQKIGLSVGLPVAAVLSFILGFYIAK